MNKLQHIVNKKWFPVIFFVIAIFISVFQHYRVFSLDVIGYHSWRQTQTQMVIDNFYSLDFNILNPRVNDLHYDDGIYRMEFPLAQWLVACLYKLFGNHLYLTRLFFYIVFFISVFGMFKLTFTLTQNKLTSLLTTWFFMFSPVLYFYSVNPLPDNLALCFGIWSLYFWFKHLKESENYLFILSCVFLALSVAVKLPFIVFGGMYLSKFYSFQFKTLKPKYILTPFFIMIPTLIWYLCVIPTWEGNGVVKGIMDNDKTVLQLLDIFQFNLFSTMPELLVNYATVPLLIIGFYFLMKRLDIKNESQNSLVWIGVLLITYFLYEMHLIDKVHDYYLFPFLPILFLIVSFAIQTISNTSNSNLKYFILLGFIICPITAYLRCNTRWNNESPGFAKEYLFYKKQLQQIIPDTAKVLICGDGSRSIVLYHLQRKGYSLGTNEMKEKDIKEGLDKGVTFLITDCIVDTNQVLKNHTSRLLFKRNDVKLYTVKQ